MKDKPKEKSFEELIGIYQGYMKTVDILGGSLNNLTNQDSIRLLKRGSRPKHFSVKESSKQ